MNGLWEFTGSCTTGRRHERQGMLCQDRVSYSHNGMRQAIALVDGIGQTDKNVLAGTRIADYVADFLNTQFGVVMTEKVQDIKFLLLRGIYRIIESLMTEFELPKEEFASTFMGVCIDHGQKKCCAVHLGDGIILHRDTDWDVLSYPVNGLGRNQTYLTVSEDALRKMKLFRGDVGQSTGYAMMTDGMYDEPVRKGSIRNIIEKEWRGGITDDDRGIAVLRKV